MTENKNVFGILGHPLGHTLSPQIHTRLFEISGEQAEYKILDTPPEKLTDSFEYFKSLTGFNITIPYKIDILKKFPFEVWYGECAIRLTIRPSVTTA